MFECLYKDKLKFDWYNMRVLRKVGKEYTKLNLDDISDLVKKRYYSDWVLYVDRLAGMYSVSSGNVYLDCPVKVSIADTDSVLSTKETRTELNLYIFMGIYKGFMNWEWGHDHFHKLNNIILRRHWFDANIKEEKVC